MGRSGWTGTDWVGADATGWERNGPAGPAGPAWIGMRRMGAARTGTDRQERTGLDRIVMEGDG